MTTKVVPGLVDYALACLEGVDLISLSDDDKTKIGALIGRAFFHGIAADEVNNWIKNKAY